MKLSITRWWKALCTVFQGRKKTTYIAPPEPAPKIEWPTQWKDHDHIRRFDDKENYPGARPGWVHVRQIATYLGHSAVNTILGFITKARYVDSGGKYYGSYVTHEYACDVVKRVRAYEEMLAAHKRKWS